MSTPATGPGGLNKTITMKCLYDHGMAAACTNATPAGPAGNRVGCEFGCAREILVKALATEDAKLGGCANVSNAMGVTFT